MHLKEWVLTAALAAAASGCDTGQLKAAKGTLQIEPVPDFGHVTLGHGATATLRIRNIGRRLVTIDDIGQQAPSLHDFGVPGGAPLHLASGESLPVTLTFSPDVLGQRATRLVVNNNSDVPRITLDLTGVGVLGKASFAPQVLDFGQVGLSSSSSLPVVFTNDAEDPAYVHITAITGADAKGFDEAPSGEVTIPSKSTHSISVRFHPWRLGKFEAALPVRPCPTCAVETVTLRGEGIAASLTAVPSPLDFGYSMPGLATVKSVVITNHGTRPVTLSAAALGSQSPAFELAAPLMNGAVLQQNQSATVAVSFKPPNIGPQTGELRVTTDDDGTPVVIVPLRGAGSSPSIQVTPDAVAFPRTAVGLTVQKQIDVRNVGTDPTGTQPLIITRVAVTSGADFSVAGVPNPFTLAASRGQYLTISYAPKTDGAMDGTLEIDSNDPLRPQVIVPLHGSASKLGDCTYKVTPPSLDFGSVAEGTHAQLSFGIRNVGANDCAVANIHLSAATAPEFALTPLSTRMITPGGQLLVPVEFAPDGTGTWTGAVNFDVNSVAAPTDTVPLTGGGVPACFAVQPQPLDFGTVGLMCKKPTLAVTLRNQCTVPVDVHRSYVGPGPSDAFSIDPAQAGAWVVNPGTQQIVDVTYTPTMAGDDSAPLYVDTSLVAAPYLVPLEGKAVDRLTQTDTFTLPFVEKVDVLWVVDNSGSMSDKQQNLANNAARFIQHATGSGIDFHLAVTTTAMVPYVGGIVNCPGGANGGEAGRFFPVDNSLPRILTNQTPHVEKVFAELVQVGVCHWIEEGLETAKTALSPPLINNAKAPNTPLPNDGNAGFLRDDARLAVIYVTDEDDIVAAPNGASKILSPIPVQTYVNQLLGLKPGRPDMVTASAIIALPGSCGGNVDGVGTRYIQLVQQMGGTIADICSPDWGGVIDAIAAAAFQPQLSFPLTKTPDDRNITVTVNGTMVPDTGAAAQQNWRYNTAIGSFGAVVFTPTSAPGPNSVVTITYDLPCPP
jgi:hypothetical protein